MITLSVNGIPAPQGSKTYIGNGRMIESSKKVGPWRDAVRAATHVYMAGHGLAPFDCPLLMVVTFFLPRPKNAPKRILHPAKYPDLSKLIRSTEDGMTDLPPDKKGNKLIGAYTDDALIVKVIASKQFANDAHPTGAEIMVVPIEAQAALGATRAIMETLDSKPLLSTVEINPDVDTVHVKHPEGLPFLWLMEIRHQRKPPN